MKVKKLVQKEVLDLSCYEVKTILERKPDQKIVKMNLNENFAVPSEAVEKLLLDACKNVDVRAYPPSRGSLAVKAISDFLGLNED